MGPQARLPRRKREDHRGSALLDDDRMSAVHRDNELPRPAVPGKMTVAEIQAQQVGVRVVISRAHHEQMFPSAPDGAARPGR
jgi:hypothetical protein